MSLKEFWIIFLSPVKNDISLIAIEQQLKLFVIGVKIPKIAKPCTIGDGIVELKKDDFR